MFLRGLPNREIEDKQTHSLEIQFVSPFVGDVFERNSNSAPSKGYVVSGGEKNLITHLQSVGTSIKKRAPKPHFT